jgi:hypothetical protein
MAIRTHHDGMTSLAPIALIDATEITRRTVRGAGAGAIVPERPGRRPWRPRAAPAAQSGSAQCSIVAAPRKPARA